MCVTVIVQHQLHVLSTSVHHPDEGVQCVNSRSSRLCCITIEAAAALRDLLSLSSLQQRFGWEGY